MNVYQITYNTFDMTACLHFWGCNFDCKGCIRRKTLLDSHLERCGVLRLNYPPHLMALNEVIGALKEVQPKRVLFMGGEPTIDPELADLAKSIQEEFQSHIVLLTNGSILPSLKHIDEICVSIKAFNDDLHFDYTGKSNSRVLKNFMAFYRSDVKLRSESIFIPGYIDCEEIADIAKFIASASPDIPYRIDGYIPVPGASWRRPAPSEVWEAVKTARKYLNNVSCLTGKEKSRGKVVKIV